MKTKSRAKGTGQKARNIGIGAQAPEKSCEDPKCPWHGSLPVRGKIIEGRVASARAQKSVVVKYDYSHFAPKYERYERRHSKVVAHKPDCIDAAAGDIVKIAECRPLSKTKHFVVVENLTRGKGAVL
jgi:small subunit ribosomal protein S17